MKKKNKTPPRLSGTAKKSIINDTGFIPVNIKNHKDSKGGHPHVIVEDIENKHVSVGLTTHQNKGKGSTNYTLDIDPLGGNKKSYMRRQGMVAPKREYDRPQKGKMTQKDYTQVKVYGERAKQKYLSKKDKKK